MIPSKRKDRTCVRDVSLGIPYDFLRHLAGIDHDEPAYIAQAANLPDLVNNQLPANANQQ